MHAHASELRRVGAEMARDPSKSSVDVSYAMFYISCLARTPQTRTLLASARHTNTSRRPLLQCWHARLDSLGLAKLCQSPFSHRDG